MATDGNIGWAILELMGHRKLGGYVTEVELAGGKFLRIDVPGEGCKDYRGPFQATQFYSPGAVYAITPVATEVAIRFAAGCRVEPVTRWELPQLAAAGRPEPSRERFDDDGDDHDDRGDDSDI